MKTLNQIHAELETATERRGELWHLLSQGHDQALADELHELEERIAALGANLVLCARKVERCEQAAAELSELGVRALGMRCDVRDPGQVQTVCERTMEELGRLDVLVNNAGTSWGAPAEETPLEGWQKVVDVNLTGVFLFSQAAGRMMIDLGG